MDEKLAKLQVLSLLEYIASNVDVKLILDRLESTNYGLISRVSYDIIISKNNHF